GAAKKLDQARASSFYAEVSNELAQARLKVSTDREGLTRMLGLWGADVDYRLPGQLPGMPRIQTAQQVEVEAIRKRVDLIAARLEL
ncbi:TolC family protein, partial [Xanthobacter sp. DSM 24535]